VAGKFRRRLSVIPMTPRLIELQMEGSCGLFSARVDGDKVETSIGE